MAQSTDTQAQVSDLATTSIDLPSGMFLLGIAGDDDARRALLRLPDGSTQLVTKGDAIAGSTVAAIDESSVILQRGGKAERLDLL